jgi:hypothetical protein
MPISIVNVLLFWRFERRQKEGSLEIWCVQQARQIVKTMAAGFGLGGSICFRLMAIFGTSLHDI